MSGCKYQICEKGLILFKYSIKLVRHCLTNLFYTIFTLKIFNSITRLA